MSVVPVISLVSVGPKSENAEAPPFKFDGYYVLFLAGTSEATIMIPLKKDFLRESELVSSQERPETYHQPRAVAVAVIAMEDEILS